MEKLDELKFLESLKSVKLSSSFKFKSLNSIKFDKTKTTKAASSVVLFGFSGWFLWHTFLAVPEPTLPPSLPQAVATIDPALAMQPPIPIVESIETAEDLIVTESEELIESIEELIVVSETQEKANEVPGHVLPDTLQASSETTDIATEQLEMTESYVDEPTSETTTLASAPMSDETPQEKQPYMLTARSNLDARDCLGLTENMAIHRCAESYR